MSKPRFQFFGTAAIGFGLAAGLVYLLMIRITLAHLEALSGQLPLDLRPFGYALEDVTALFEGLGEDGRRYYLTRQLLLDTFYPALLALTLVCTMMWLGQRLPNSKLVRAGVVLSIGTAFFDYCENLGIAVMITSWPDLPDTLARGTSVASVAKSGLTIFALSLLFLIVLRWIRHRKADV